MIQLHFRLIGPVIRPYCLIFGLLRQLDGLVGLILRTGSPLLALIGLALSLLRLTLCLIRITLGLLRLICCLLRLICGLLRLLTNLLRLLNRMDCALVRHLCLMMHLPCLRLRLACQSRGLVRGLAGVLCVEACFIAVGLALNLCHFRVSPRHIKLVTRAGACRRPPLSGFLGSYILCCHIRAPFQKVWVVLGKNSHINGSHHYRSCPLPQQLRRNQQKGPHTRGSAPA
ncbi:hypothetical protein AB0L63_02070 [Nocardia sp. NPDC051990]|uniref:hypothetical protein n=1 Tax=Nocardia sp. NPDC051990 TaxID=3155285 RepID=UPI0034408F88